MTSFVPTSPPGPCPRVVGDLAAPAARRTRRPERCREPLPVDLLPPWPPVHRWPLFEGQPNDRKW